MQIKKKGIEKIFEKLKLDVRSTKQRIDLDDYISRLESEGKEEHLEELKELQNEGVETLIKVVEIKSDEEQDEATPAKEEYAKAHFERVNKKLSRLPLADIDAQYRADAKQYYTFDLLTPHQYHGWIADLKKGTMREHTGNRSKTMESL